MRDINKVMRGQIYQIVTMKVYIFYYVAKKKKDENLQILTFFSELWKKEWMVRYKNIYSGENTLLCIIPAEHFYNRSDAQHRCSEDTCVSQRSAVTQPYLMSLQSLQVRSSWVRSRHSTLSISCRGTWRHNTSITIMHFRNAYIFKNTGKTYRNIFLEEKSTLLCFGCIYPDMVNTWWVCFWQPVRKQSHVNG